MSLRKRRLHPSQESLLLRLVACGGIVKLTPTDPMDYRGVGPDRRPANGLAKRGLVIVGYENLGDVMTVRLTDRGRKAANDIQEELGLLAKDKTDGGF